MANNYCADGMHASGIDVQLLLNEMTVRSQFRPHVRHGQILAKVGVAGIDANQATAVRTSVVVVFVILFAALFGERLRWPTVAGGMLILAGAITIALG